MNRFIHILSFSLLCSFVFSCEGSESDIPGILDVTSPEIRLITPIENSRVKGMVSISAAIEDSSKVISLKVYIDGTLIKELGSDEVTVEFDTKTVSDGIHTIQIMATDEAGNTSSKSFTIEVQNILFAVDIPEGYVRKNAVIYFVLSRNDGSLLAYEKIQDGSSVVIDMPDDFNPDSTFVFTEYFYLKEESSFINFADVYTSIGPGQYSLPAFLEPGVVGKHRLTVTEVPDHRVVFIEGEHTKLVSGTFRNQNEINVDIEMNNKTSDLFFSLTPNPEGAPLYNYIEAIKAGEASAFSVSELPTMSKHTVALRSVATSIQAHVRGYQNDSQQGIMVFSYVGSSANPELNFYLPANAFSNYLTDLVVTEDSKYYRNQIWTPTASPSFQYLDSEIESLTYSKGILEVETSGDFDICTVHATTNNFENGVLTSNGYYVSFPHGIHRINMPQMPQEILDYGMASLDGLEFDYVAFSDYNTLVGLLDYQKKIVFSEDKKSNYDRVGMRKSYSLSTNDGGRLHSSAKVLLKQLRYHRPWFVGE
jgi:hypothetical protein